MIAAVPSPDGRGTSRRSFEVLVVCTANLCRSPIMEARLRADLAPLADTFVVRSAGTAARDGLPVHPDSARALAGQGLALDETWRSHALTDADVTRADLVLTATREHRGQVLARVPGAAGRTFTLRQFGRLIAAAPAGVVTGAVHPGDALVVAAMSARGLARPADPADDDLSDPIGRPFRAFRETAETVTAVSAAISSAGSSPGSAEWAQRGSAGHGVAAGGLRRSGRR